MNPTGPRWLWLVPLLAGCGEVLLEPPDPPAKAWAPERTATHDAPRVPVVLAGGATVDAAACAHVRPARLDFSDVLPGEEARLDVEVGGCDVPDLVRAAIVEGDRAFAVSPHSAPGTYLVTFRPLVSGRDYRGTLRLFTEDPAAPELRVALSGHGAFDRGDCSPWTATVDSAERPGAAAAGDLVVLDAQPPPGADAKGTAVRWVVFERPAGSVTQPQETAGQADSAATSAAQFSVDLPGSYGFEARITPPESSGCPEQVVRTRLRACPCPGDLQVQVAWRAIEPEARAGVLTDLDLHLLHPSASAWGAAGLDCHAGDGGPAWGDPGAADDPTLDGDVTRAPGREGIALERMGEGLYRIGVQAYRPLMWGGMASVRVFLGERLAWESGERQVGDGVSFWDVGGVARLDGRLVMVPYDRLWRTSGELPRLDEPLAAGAPCLPGLGPACQEQTRCLTEPGADHGRCLTGE